MESSSTLHGAAASFVATRAVGTLATADAIGTPSLVPICFAWDGTDLWIALDSKPKSVADVLRLKRVRNIQARPQVAVLVHDYLAQDWAELAQVQVRGIARIVPPDDPTHAAAIALLRTK